jgi:hypothetical protein
MPSPLTTLISCSGSTGYMPLHRYLESRIATIMSRMANIISGRRTVSSNAMVKAILSLRDSMAA